MNPQGKAAGATLRCGPAYEPTSLPATLALLKHSDKRMVAMLACRLLFLIILIATTVGCGKSHPVSERGDQEEILPERVAGVDDLERQLKGQLPDRITEVKIDAFNRPTRESNAAVLIGVYVNWKDEPGTTHSGDIEAFSLSDNCLAGTLVTNKDDVPWRFPVVLRID